MSYSSQYRGSPWQQGSYPYDVSRYSQAYGRYSLSNHYSMMNALYHEGYSSVYGRGAVGSVRSMEYSSPSVYYLSERSSGYQNFHGQNQLKRLSSRIAAGDPRSKRLKLENNSRRDRQRTGWRRRRDPQKTKKTNKSDIKSVETADTDNDYDSWKSSDDETGTTATKDNQQSANGVEKTEVKTEESDKAKDFKKTLACHVCKVKCSTLERFGNHMSSRTHNSKMEKLLVLQKEKKQALEGGTKASQQVESRDRLKKDRRKRKQWCRICQIHVTGRFLAHSRSVEHKKMREKKFPKCYPCGVGFNSPKEYREHCREERHKLKSAEYHYRRNLASGSDNDPTAIEPVKVPTPALDDLESKGKQSEDKKTEDKQSEDSKSEDKKSEDKQSEDKKSEDKKSAETKEIQPVGQLFVVPAKGYYCKICCMFFKEASVARVKHCCSEIHSGGFKKAMKEAMEQEEERQKLADEQEKLEEEAARIAAEKAAAEKAEESKKETVENKETENANDSGSQKSSDQSGNTNVENMEVTDAVENKQVDVTTEEMKEENAPVVKMEVSDISVVANKEETQVNGDTKEVKVAATGGKPSEIAQSDDQRDKEDEEIKKESPGSRGARRSRGRGRRR